MQLLVCDYIVFSARPFSLRASVGCPVALPVKSKTRLLLKIRRLPQKPIFNPSTHLQRVCLLVQERPTFESCYRTAGTYM